MNKEKFLNIDNRLKELAEKENISFLKTLFKFKPQCSAVNSKQIEPAGADDDSRSYIKEILDICQNNPANANQQNLQIKQTGLSTSEIENKKILADNSISSINSLGVEPEPKYIPTDDFQLSIGSRAKTSEEPENKKPKPKENTIETNKIYHSNKTSAKSKTNSNTNSTKKTKCFNNKKNVKQIEELLRQTKKIEENLLVHQCTKDKKFARESIFDFWGMSDNFNVNFLTSPGIDPKMKLGKKNILSLISEEDFNKGSTAKRKPLSSKNAVNSYSFEARKYKKNLTAGDPRKQEKKKNVNLKKSEATTSSERALLKTEINLFDNEKFNKAVKKRKVQEGKKKEEPVKRKEKSLSKLCSKVKLCKSENLKLLGKIKKNNSTLASGLKTKKKDPVASDRPEQTVEAKGLYLTRKKIDFEEYCLKLFH